MLENKFPACVCLCVRGLNLPPVQLFSEPGRIVSLLRLYKVWFFLFASMNIRKILVGFVCAYVRLSEKHESDFRAFSELGGMLVLIGVFKVWFFLLPSMN